MPARRRWYGRRLGEQRAQQFSTASALGLFGGYFTWLNRRWPLPDDRKAWQVGGVRASLTVLFEFGFGHFVAGQSWQELLDDREGTSAGT